MAHWRILAVAAVLVAYALLSWALMTYWPTGWLAVATLFGPALVGMALSGVVQKQPRTLLACAALTAVLLFTLSLGVISANLLYVIQHATIHGVLAWTFGISLRAGSQPLITAMAERIHEHFSEAQRTYTRQLTLAWTLYFLGMIALSALLYALAPWSAWSVFCNVATPLMALGFFAFEHVLRYRLHPEFERVTLAAAARAYRSIRATP
jgi:uncharacterized membrane protein